MLSDPLRTSRRSEPGDALGKYHPVLGRQLDGVVRLEGALGANDPRVIAKKLRVALRLSFIIGIPGMIVLGAGAHFLLSMFGRGYSGEATVPLELLVLGYPLGVPKALYIAVCRASGRITRAAVVLTTFSAAELGAATVGALAHGLIGLSLLLLA